MPAKRVTVATVPSQFCNGCQREIKSAKMAVIVRWEVKSDLVTDTDFDLENEKPSINTKDGTLVVRFPGGMPLAKPFKVSVYHLDGCGVVTRPHRHRLVGDAGRGKRNQ